MKRKKTKTTQTSKLFGDVIDSAQDIIAKLGISNSMSQLRMVQTARAYIDEQPNTLRTCNAILYKLGIQQQIKDSPRKARIYALTAIDEAIKQGTSYLPASVPEIAERRLSKIETIIGREVIYDSDTTDSPSKQTKKDQATEVYLQFKDSPKELILSKIMAKLSIERQAAQCYLYQVKRALTV